MLSMAQRAVSEIEVFCHLRPCDAEAYLEPSQTSI